MEENQIHIPEGWVSKELGGLIKENRKSTLKVSDAANFGEYPFFTSGEAVLQHTSKQLFGKNIFLATGGVANIKFYDGDAAYSTDTYAVTTKDEIETEYLYYDLLNIIYYINANYFQGSGLKHLQKKDLKKHQILFPKNQKEQTQIATILSKVDEAITQTEQLIAKYTRIKTGLMQDLLTRGIDEDGNIRSEETHEFKDSPLGRIPKEWECILIDDLANLKSGGTPSRQNSSFWNGDIPWVKTGEVNYKLIKETEEYITEKGLKMSSTVLFPKGTILMALYGQGKTRGRVSILDIDATTNQACVGFLNLQKVTTNFLFIALTNEYEKLRDLSNDGAQKNLSSGLLKKYLLKIPSDIEEQLRIDKIFAGIDTSLLKEQQSLSKLKSLKTGLMQDLLSGKVRVNYLIKETVSI